MEASIASIIFFNSGMTEIRRSTRKILKRRKTKKLELFGIGIKETATMIVSNTFQPFLKKSFFLGSPT